MNNRLETLESKLAHLELTVDELNQVVFQQTKQLDVAHAQIANLQNRLKEMADDMHARPHSIEDDRPPHY